ncbi:MAG: nucleoside kinase [Fidelibacterota bacterium]|nr:MAG: nucleoside kinase [Candidatus Neomarinimicrobiota bacterium]
MEALPNNNRHPSAVHASLGFLLSAAVEELFPDRTLFIEHSFIGGYYCHFGLDDPATADDLQALTRCLDYYCSSESPLEIIEVKADDLQMRYRERGRDDKLEILQRLGSKVVPAARFRHYLDYRIEPMTPDLSRLRPFSINPYDHGFLLRFPSLLPPYTVPPLKDSPKLYQVIQQREEWGRALGVNNLCQLNERLEGEQGRELVWVAEGLHEKTIARIADGLCAKHNTKRVIFISGPSSSGKTTFAKRLAIQLKVNLFDTLAISMDDYFRDHADIKSRPDPPVPVAAGLADEPDFESLDAVNVPRLIGDIQVLLAGQSIPRRQFFFKEGRGKDTDDMLRLSPDTFLIVEGIHGLNPVFPRELGPDAVQRIYVSAITQLNVDNEHRISSSDNRLLRRLVRDAQFRGYSAQETLIHWSEVRLGEERHIFTYQEQADFMFNSSLVYELAVLRSQAEKVLRAVPETSPAYPEARRLLTFLSFVATIDDGTIPGNSILREFLGGSAFEY